MTEVEICVDSLESSRNASDGGCDRIELCSALSEGGLTPTSALLQAVKKIVKVPVYCMVRCRGGDMVFSPEEGELMVQEAKDLVSRGADGLVFGALTAEGEINISLCARIKEIGGKLPCTFHRAFDLLSDPLTQLEVVIDLGYEKILTSGCKPTAKAGSATVKTLVSAAGSRIGVMAGAGVNSSNVRELLDVTAVRQVHSSAKVCRTNQSTGVNMGAREDSERWVTDSEEVKALVAAVTVN